MMFVSTIPTFGMTALAFVIRRSQEFCMPPWLDCLTLVICLCPIHVSYLRFVRANSEGLFVQLVMTTPVDPVLLIIVLNIIYVFRQVSQTARLNRLSQMTFRVFPCKLGPWPYDVMPNVYCLLFLLITSFALR